MVRTKDVEIDWEDKKEIVILRKLSFGEMNDINQEATTIKSIGGVPQVVVNQKILKEKSLSLSISKAPFSIDLKSIRDLDNDTGGLLWEEFAELNQQKKREEA